MERNGWLDKIIWALVVLIPAVGFAASIYFSITGGPIEVSSQRNSGEESNYTLTAADFPENSDVGNRVGHRVPDFTLELADGSAVTSASLVASGRPTFLFFWATV